MKIMEISDKIERIGIIAMPILSTGGGFNRTAIDLISALNSMKKEVYLLNPFNVDFRKIKEMYGADIKIKKIYWAGKIRNWLCREEILGRKIMIKNFQKMAKETDFIIDMDGCVFHRYLPGDFKRENYIVWKISCINPETPKIQKYFNWKMKIKKVIRKLSLKKEDIPKREIKIYPIDEWTKRELIQFWGVKPQDLCLYSEIKTDEFIKNRKKKEQAVIFSRIAPNKNIIDSIKIFYAGTKKFPSSKLVILGGSTKDTHAYLEKINTLLDNLKIRGRVKIIPDPSFDKIKEILAESSVIIDSQIGTSMHMPVIEAMASGCQVIMQKNSGTYKEVLENGRYGYGFDNVEEGRKELEKILENLNKKDKRKELISRAEFFSSKNFKIRLKMILNKEV